MKSKAESEINHIRQQIENCKNCPLWKTRLNPVAGEGMVTAKVMLIGEAPGKNEDIQGRPFVGRAGKLLDELIQSICKERKEIFITNIVKCRPPKNRNPLKSEIKTCTNYLDKQIKLIHPQIIVPLGNFATSYILKKFGISEGKIGMIHGRTYQMKNNSTDSNIIPMYHPAAAIYNPNLKETLEKDFKKIRNLLYNK
jgi:DNA polymerase